MAALTEDRLHPLIIDQYLWLKMCSHANKELPEEACGLLAGKGQQVVEIYPVPNILHSPMRYRMDPAYQLRVFLDIEESGLELTGIYHTHPRGPNYPSETDIAEAYYPESIYVILCPQANGWLPRGFIINTPAVKEIPLVIKMDE
jgi:proteasome lid subunit RPN8/RPN11